VINARSTDAWQSTYEWILCTVGETVAVLMSGDDQKLSIAVLHSKLPLILMVLSWLDTGVQSATEMLRLTYCTLL